MSRTELGRARALLVVAGVAVLSLWLVFRGGGGAPEPDLEPIEVEAPASRTRSVWIDSAAGVPLADLLVELEDGRRAALQPGGEGAEGRHELPRAAHRLHAAGHLPLDVGQHESDARLVLEPDALLELESPAGRELGVRVLRDRKLGTAPAHSFGWSAEERWTAAVTAEAAESFALSARIGPWTRAMITFEPERGRRARLELPGPRASAPLEVELVHSLGEPPGSTRVRAEETDAAPEPTLSREPWGHWSLLPETARASLRWEPGRSKQLDLGPLPLGAQVALQGRDEHTGAWGRIEFVHDGTPRRLELHGGLSIAGRVRSSGAGGSSAKGWSGGRVRAAFLHGDGRDLAPDEELLWRAETPLDEDGSFRLAFPAVPPPSSATEPEAPPRLLLAIEAAGHVTLERELPAPDADLLLEEWVLEPLPAGAVARLTLVPGLDLAGARSVDCLEGEVRRSRPVVGWIPLGESGGPALDLGSAPGSPPFKAWRAADAELALVSLGEEPEARVVAIERAAGRWRAVPTRRRDLVVTVDGLPERHGAGGERAWSVGWSWRGFSTPLARFGAEDVGVRTTLVLEIPARETRIDWEASGGEQRGSFTARGGTLLLRLPPRPALEPDPVVSADEDGE